MKTLPNLLTLTLAASIGAFASTSLTALALNHKPAEQQQINQQPHPALVVDITGNWLRVSQETQQGLYLSLPAQRWIF